MKKAACHAQNILSATADMHRSTLSNIIGGLITHLYIYTCVKIINKAVKKMIGAMKDILDLFVKIVKHLWDSIALEVIGVEVAHLNDMLFARY